MFTGIVQRVGVVVAAESAGHGRVLLVDAGDWGAGLEPGDSVAVSGCCLTVAGLDDGPMRFDVVRQTLGATTLGRLQRGDGVNLERPVTLGDLLSGHVVQGHVDGVGVVTAAGWDEADRRLRIEPPPELLPTIVARGSIAVDGVSLTVAVLGDAWFEVALVPETIRRTTLGRLEAGAPVDLETDYLVKAVARYLEGERRSDEATPRV